MIQKPTLTKTLNHISIKKNECILERSERTLKFINFKFSRMLIFPVHTLVEVIVLNLSMHMIMYIHIYNIP